MIHLRLFSVTVKPATCVSELAEFYRDSCRHHNAAPIETIMKHLDTLDLSSHTRRPILNLREQNLTAESCEALEEVLKRVSRRQMAFHNVQSYRVDKGTIRNALSKCAIMTQFVNNGNCSISSHNRIDSALSNAIN